MFLRKSNIMFIFPYSSMRVFIAFKMIIIILIKVYVIWFFVRRLTLIFFFFIYLSLFHRLQGHQSYFTLVFMFVLCCRTFKKLMMLIFDCKVSPSRRAVQCLFLASTKFRDSVNMRLTFYFTSHDSYVEGSFLAIRRLYVVNVCPIRSRSKIVSSFLFRPGICHISKLFFIVFNCVLQYIQCVCHSRFRTIWICCFVSCA